MKHAALMVPLVAVALTACQTVERVTHDTPSGRPEVTFPNTSTEEIRSLLINTNIDEGFILVESSDNVLEFKKPPERQRLHFYFSDFPHTRYPNIRVIYNVFEGQGGTRTVASVWSVGSPGTINEYKIGINDLPISNEVQQFMNDLLVAEVNRQTDEAEGITTADASAAVEQ